MIDGYLKFRLARRLRNAKLSPLISLSLVNAGTGQVAGYMPSHPFRVPFCHSAAHYRKKHPRQTAPSDEFSSVIWEMSSGKIREPRFGWRISSSVKSLQAIIKKKKKKFGGGGDDLKRKRTQEKSEPKWVHVNIDVVRALLATLKKKNLRGRCLNYWLPYRYTVEIRTPLVNIKLND